ncbi:MAG: UDP-N-acetylmuramoyl-L-alanyl-D-glutamate--2,6-diaminopimelate ligase [Saprospirales bacterium]|nr:MAG: UDP-N-acetylmuramoyl-L-alanyl-D-glutamate--2,6-diaminopimelate ligase [Saprospirales bacterium]
MKVKDLLKNVEIVAVNGDWNDEVVDLFSNSGKVIPNSLFVAIKGAVVDGNQFINDALEKGCSWVVSELECPESFSANWVQVKNSRKTWALICSEFFGNPSDCIELIGVTGTNGKTTIVNLLFDLFLGLDIKVGMLSTIGNKIGKDFYPGTHTTPDAYEINAILSKMVDEGCRYAFMEVSSHALDQDRTAGLTFAGGVFTNITHDHLDYHGTFSEYIKAKKKFFDELSLDSFALFNADDKNGKVMMQNTKAEIFSYSISRDADYKSRIIENSIEGLQLVLDRFEAHFMLSGEYNASNITAVYAVGRILGFSSVELLTAMSKIKAPEGRFDHVHFNPDFPKALVDYAHTPDALKNILESIAQLKRQGQKLIVVFGCGGDRDKTKRPEMGKIAARYGDEVIITSDNPRTENPATIIEDVAQGIKESDLYKVRRVTDRAEAIRTACRIARNEDIILVAGKGHEKYQEIKGKKVPFDDKEKIREALGFPE